MISKRAFKVLLVALALLFLSPARIFASPPSECSANDLLALLRPDDPAYSDAMELSQFLKTRGFTVKCVGQSKSINLSRVSWGPLSTEPTTAILTCCFCPSQRLLPYSLSNVDKTAGTYTLSVEIHGHLAGLGIVPIPYISFSSQINCLSQMIVGCQKTYRKHYIRSRNEIPITTPD